MNMNVELTEQEIKNLVEKEVTKCVHNKIISVMNDGYAGWFTQQNVQLITYRVIRDMMQNNFNEFFENSIKEMDRAEFCEKFSKSFAENMADWLFQ